MQLTAWVLTLMLWTIETCAEAQGPEWIWKVPIDDERFVYLVGRGQGPQLADAKREAEQDARNQLLQSYLGVTTGFKQQSLLGTRTLELHASASAHSPIVHLKSLEERELHLTREGDGKLVFVLYRFPKEEAGRLRRISSSAKFQSLSIDSSPTGADVFVGATRIGSTPLKGVLPVGLHRITLRKSGYQEVVRSVELGPQDSVSLSMDLAPLVGWLQLSCIPGDATVQLNHVRSRCGQRLALPGGRYQLRIEQPGYIPFQKSGRLEQGATEVLHVALTKLSVGKTEEAVPEQAPRPWTTIELLQWAGFAALDQKDFREALRLSALLANTPGGKEPGAFLRAEVRVALRQYRLAEAEYREATGGSQHRNRTQQSYRRRCRYSALASLHSENSPRYASATACEEALEQHPLDASSHESLGMIRELRGEIGAARAAFETAFELDPDYRASLVRFCRDHGWRSGSGLKKGCR